MNAEAVSSILKEGMIVSTRSGTSHTWHRNVVYGCEGSTICLSLLDKYMEDLVFPGSTILIKYWNELFEYILEGSITNIDIKFPGRITVQVGKIEEIVNTRIYPRQDTCIACYVRPLWSSTSYFSIVSNLSHGGMAFVSIQRFDYGEECEITLRIPDGQTICATGKVIRRNTKNPFIDYSMQFTRIDEAEAQKLSHYIKSLENLDLALQQQFLNYKDTTSAKSTD